jgi:hypothetical protein
MLALALALFLTPAQAAPFSGTLQCQAIYRTLDAQGKGIEETAPMPVTFNQGGVVKYSASLEGRYFVLTEDGQDPSLLGQIVEEPDYHKGLVSRGNPDAQGRFTLSSVDGVTVYRLECAQQHQL